MSVMRFRVDTVNSRSDLGLIVTHVNFVSENCPSEIKPLTLSDIPSFSIDYEGQPKHKVGDKFNLEPWTKNDVG